MTYTTQKVLDIIKNYKHYHEAVTEYKKEYSSVGVTVYDENDIMPRANTISDVTANEALKHVKDVSVMSEMATDIKYLQDRLHRVPKEYEDILDLRLSGHTVREIAFLQHRSYSHINR